jgi:cell division protein FtsB
MDFAPLVMTETGKSICERKIKMKSPVSRMLLLTVGIVFGIMLITGCEEEGNLSDTQSNTTANSKRSRLIVIENAQLKAQIEELKKLHSSEIEKQKKLLDNCMREKKALDEMSKKGVDNYMQNILGPLAEENTKLREENKTLKAQIEKLKTEPK